MWSGINIRGDAGVDEYDRDSLKTIQINMLMSNWYMLHGATLVVIHTTNVCAPCDRGKRCQSKQMA